LVTLLDDFEKLEGAEIDGICIWLSGWKPSFTESRGYSE